MRRSFATRALLFASLGLAAPFAHGEAAARKNASESESALDVATVRLITADGRAHGYKVEIARTPAEQARGLMHRREMARDRGMLFPFDPPHSASFWMANTYIALDIIFIGADGRVLNIGVGKPLSRRTVNSAGYVSAVLELNAGEAARIGLKRGDRVEIPSR